MRELAPDIILGGMPMPLAPEIDILILLPLIFIYLKEILACAMN